MDLEGKAVWQVAAGDTDRSYHDLCLRWGVILFGPGYQGVWPECAFAVLAMESEPVDPRL